MPRPGHFLADATEISTDGVSERHLDRPFLKRNAHRVGQLLFSRCLEIDAFNAIRATLFRCALSELSAQPGLIDAAPAHHRQFQKLVKTLLLSVKGLLRHFNNATSEINAAHLLDQPDHGEVVLTAHVNTNEQRILAVEKISLPLSAFAIFA